MAATMKNMISQQLFDNKLSLDDLIAYLGRIDDTQSLQITVSSLVDFSNIFRLIAQLILGCSC